jgi:O-methyltransferase involved in polyketide biosynthesis
VTEGLLVYFAPEQVGRLSSDLAAHAAYGWWITDIVSPTLLKMLVRSKGALDHAQSKATYFGPAEGAAFFRPFGWCERAYRSSIVDAVRLGRAPQVVRAALWLSRLLPGGDPVSRLSAHILLERESIAASGSPH